RFVKLELVWLFRVADSGVPSGLNRSTRADIDVVAVFASTISVAQPPPTANCGSKTAPAPPMPVEIVGTAPPGEIFVMGIVLKFAPRKRKPTTDTALGAVTVSVPRKSAGKPTNCSVTNFDTCCIAGTVTVGAVVNGVPSSLLNVNVTFTGVF